MTAPIWPSRSVVAQSSAQGCQTSGRVARSVAGASLGAFIGLVAVKIKYSDWSDVTHTPTGIQARNRALFLGAVVGASVGNLPLLSAGCSRPGQVPRPGGDARSIISADDIQKFSASGSVYDLILAVRRQWLNTRGVELSEVPTVTGSEQAPQVIPGAPTLIVYLDNARLGGLEQLHTLPITGVVAVRYYDASQATQRWGTGHRHGAIQVFTVTEDSRHIAAPDQRP